MALQARHQVWEYGLLPIHALCPSLDVNALYTANQKLIAKSTTSPDGERIVSAADAAQALDLTPTQVDALYEVLSALSLCNANLEVQPGQEPIHVHELVLYLFALLFSKEAQRPDNMEYWANAESPFPSGGPGMALGTELLSPTRQLVRSMSQGKAMLRQQLQQHLRNQNNALRGFGDYLRRNMRLLLELCLDKPVAPGGSTRITAREVDRIAFLLRLARPRQGLPLSSLVPALSSPSGLPLDQVVAALRPAWSEDLVLDSPRVSSGMGPMGGLGMMGFRDSGSFSSSSGGSSMAMSPKPNRALGMIGSSGQVDESHVSGVQKGTVVRGELDLPQAVLHITDCHDAVVYVLGPLQHAYVTGCSDCTIVLGAVGRLTRLERCDKVQLVAASSRVAVSSCHDCALYLGTSRPPLLLGDNRFLRLAPFNTRYERQLQHLRAAGVRLDMPNKWDCPLVLAGKERKSISGGTPDSPHANSASASSSSLKPPYTLLPPDDFFPFVVPFQGGPGQLAGGPAPATATRWSSLGGASVGGASPAASKASGLYLFPLPPEYERALHRKLGMTAELRQKFKQAGLSKDKERELNDTIQAYFKDWLASSSTLRQIYDLSNLERAEDQQGQGQGGPALA